VCADCGGETAVMMRNQTSEQALKIITNSLVNRRVGACSVPTIFFRTNLFSKNRGSKFIPKDFLFFQRTVGFSG
jgi:hypothetical protein